MTKEKTEKTVYELLGESLSIVRDTFSREDLTDREIDTLLSEAKSLVGEANRIKYYAQQRKHMNQLGLVPNTVLYECDFRYVVEDTTYTCLTIDESGNLFGQPLKGESIGRGVGMVPVFLGHISMIEHSIKRNKAEIIIR